jgi:hypothetical protein
LDTSSARDLSGLRLKKTLNSPSYLLKKAEIIKTLDHLFALNRLRK